MMILQLKHFFKLCSIWIISSYYFSIQKVNYITRKLAYTYVSYSMSEQIVANELKGNTLRVYWYLLNSSSHFIGPRQIQRELGFSSPSLAVYHLDKLLDLGLVKKNNGEYQLKDIVDVGILKQFMKWKGVIIPRHVTYATMISTLFIFFLTQLRVINFYSIFALIFGSLDRKSVV